MSNYRDTFFFFFKPSKNGLYRCAYCKKNFTKEEITVDHLIPQNSFKKTKKGCNAISIVLLILGLKINPVFLIGIIVCVAISKLSDKSMNAPANLVASCQSCNSSKSDNIDSRILIGATSNLLPNNILNYLVALIITIAGKLIKLAFILLSLPFKILFGKRRKFKLGRLLHGFHRKR